MRHSVQGSESAALGGEQARQHFGKRVTNGRLGGHRRRDTCPVQRLRHRRVGPQCADVEQILRGHTTMIGAQDSGGRAELAQARLKRGQRTGSHQIGLADHGSVRHGNLADRLELLVQRGHAGGGTG